MAIKNFEDLTDLMEGLGSKTDGVLKVATKEAADFCVKTLRKKSRALFGNGKYAKGWRVKKTMFGYEIYNVTFYGHVLENGHAVVDENGVSHGYAPGRHHVAEVEKETEKFYEEKIQEGLSKI